MTRRRWIADTWNDATAALHGDQAQHLSRVLRAQPGMEFDVVAGGRAWLARIASIDREASSSHFSTSWKPHPRSPSRCFSASSNSTAWSGPSRKRWSWAAGRIVPVLAERTEKHLAQAADKRVERWRRLALEAAKQSRRSDLPEIAESDPVSRQFLHRRTSGDQQEIQPGKPHLRRSASCSPRWKRISRCYAFCQENAAWPASEIMLAIGPEGGWTAAEIALFTGAGWQSASLGPRILRVETAAIAALAIVNAAACL